METKYIFEPYSKIYTCTCYENLNGIKLMIIGEDHTDSTICNDWEDTNPILLFNKLYKNKSEECLDLFIEVFFINSEEKKGFKSKSLDYTTEENSPKFTHVDMLFVKYMDDITESKAKHTPIARALRFGIYKLSHDNVDDIRIHYIDPRKDDIIKFDIDSLITENFKNVKNFKNKKNKNSNKEFSTTIDYDIKDEYNNILNKIIDHYNIDKVEIIKMFINGKKTIRGFTEYMKVVNYCFIHPKVVKIIDIIIEKENIKSVIKIPDFINETYISNNLDKYFHIINKRYHKLNMSTDDKIRFIKTLEDLYIDMITYTSFTSVLISLNMDIYTLCRLFTKFSSRVSKYKCSDTIRNCIMTIGNAHLNNFIKFFNMFFKCTPDYNVTRSGIEDEEFCINVPINYFS